MTERIDHAAEARKVAEPLENNQHTSRQAWLAEAQLHATLALVDQQRVASLIALSQTVFPDDSRAFIHHVADPVGSYGVKVKPEIAAALGIEVGETDV